MDNSTMLQTQNSTQLFPTPLHGSVKGKPVRILAVGDIPGNSPSYLVVNDQGFSTWLPLTSVTIIDTACLPISTQAFDALSLGNKASNR